MKEIWKPIKGFTGYEASDLGNIRGFRDFHGNVSDKFTVLKPRVNKDGYYELTIYTDDHKKVTKLVHRLIAETFLGKNPKLVVNHIDGNKLNNNVNNLEYVSAKENSTLAAENGLYKTKPVRIVETGEVFDSIKECAKAIKSDPADISNCIAGRKNESIKGMHFELINKGEPKRDPFLYDYQMDSIKRLKNGNILCGSVGSGKSRTGLFYYFKENGGWIDEYGYVPMKNPQDLYIITTAKKRDSLEWCGELSPFLMSVHPETNRYSNKIVIDSWNNIVKYVDVEGAFFLFDEQRLVSYGSWTKAFLKIAKKNKWILLTATPGDSYMDYLPVFLANGFFKNKTEFTRNHVVYSRFSKYPKIDRFVETQRLDRLRRRILVNMNYKHQINAHHEDIYCDYDVKAYKDVTKNRWNVFKDEPIVDAGGLCYVLRQVVNTDISRQEKLLELLEKHSKMIVFYNFNYELDILRSLAYPKGVEVAEYNGQKHQPIPEGSRWVYLCQYTAAAEGWQCIRTNAMVFYSQNYSYKIVTQAAGRIDRLNTPYKDLYYYHLKSRSGIDLAISKALKQKKNFNERRFVDGSR